jgi:Uma2 family endonuclease
VATQPKHPCTPTEYLAIDRAAETKSEYLDGVIYGMGGASARHVQIVGNLVRELGNQLREKNCTVYSTDLRVCVDPDGMYAYPDVAAACGEPTFLDARMDTLMNPVLIIEVLSETTKNYDRGEKFERYRRIPSFCEYLLIAQDKIHVERFVKQSDGTWVFHETDTAGDTIEPSSIGCRMPLSEIYFKVTLPDPPTTRDSGL